MPQSHGLCLSRTLRGHLSRSDATVGTVGPFCALVARRDHWDKGDAFLSAGDSQYPLSTAHRLRTGSGTSREPPSDSPLGSILRNWKKFDPKNLKKKRLTFFCNTAWSQYQVGDREQWPLNGTLNYNTILQLDLFCQKKGKDSEVPYVKTFMALSQNPDLRDSCRMCLSVAALSPRPPLSPSPADLLDDPLLDLSRPPPHQPPLLQPHLHLNPQLPISHPLIRAKAPSPLPTQDRGLPNARKQILISFP